MHDLTSAPLRLIRRIDEDVSRHPNDHSSVTARTSIAAVPMPVGVGDRAPAFALPSARGSIVELQRLLDWGPVVISFYRGAWCPYCSLELRGLQTALPDIRRAGGSLVAISPQTPDESLSTRQKAELTFHVLSDVGNVVSRRYGLAHRLPGAARALYEEFEIDLPTINGTDDWELPVPATYVVATDGSVRFAFADHDYRHRAEPADVIRALHDIAAEGTW